MYDKETKEFSLAILSAYFCLFLLSLNNTLVSLTIAGISLDRLFEAIVFIFLLPFIFRKFLNDQYFAVFIVMILAMILLKAFILVFDASISVIGFDSLTRALIRVFYFIIFFCVAYFGFFVLGIRGVTFIILLTSPYFLLAFMQHPITPLSEFSFAIHEALYSGNMNQDASSEAGYVLIEYQKLGFMLRPTGPYGSTIALSYALIPVMGLTLFAYIYKNEKRYYFWFLFLVLISILSLTRSLIVGAAILLLSVTLVQLLIKRDRILILILATFSIFMALLLYQQFDLFNRIFSFSDVFVEGGMSERQIAWLSGLRALIENPLYFNADHYMDFYKSFCTQSSNCLAYISMHNGFLRVGRDFSIFGLLIYVGSLVWFFYISLKQDLVYKIIFSSVFLAYIANTMFHNNTLFISEYTILIWIALLFNFDNGKSLNKTFK